VHLVNMNMFFLPLDDCKSQLLSQSWYVNDRRRVRMVGSGDVRTRFLDDDDSPTTPFYFPDNKMGLDFKYPYANSSCFDRM
jgi:hypothetical protein